MFWIKRKFELKKIRNSIINSSNLLEKNKPTILDEKTVKSINCYAYSLGIMYNGERGIHYSPGYTTNKKYNGISPEELMRYIELDLKNLRISFRRIELKEKFELDESEYLIKVFFTPQNSRMARGDFHLIRQDRKTQKWFHKMGWNNQPCLTQLDCDYKKKHLGQEPNRITTRENDGFSFVYLPVCYLAITEV